MITIKDVANRAGVSASTASRALRSVGYVGKETYDKVIRASMELGYIANSTAQQLKTNTLKTVGFIISDINNEYYIGILSTIQKMLSDLGMDLIIAFSSENPVDEEKSFRSLIASRVCAILFTPTSKRNEEITCVAKQNGIKVIQLFRDIYDGLDTIINDDESGCCSATKHLLELGYRRLLLVDVVYSHLDFSEVKPNRSVGFLQTLKASGIAAESEIFHFPLVDYDLSQLTDTLERFAPDAVITATNRMGFAVLSYLKQTNKSVKLVSFDDNEWLELCGVTAIRQNREILTRTICELICSDNKTVKKKKIPQTLIVR